MGLSRTGSTLGVYRRNGELIAIPHKSTNAAEWKTATDATTRQSTMAASFRDPNLKTQLTPYHPNAPRNRLPVKFKDEPTHGKRFCKDRNAQSYYPPKVSEPGFERFRTTSQNFYAYDTSTLAVGGTNQGIVAIKSRIIHANQFR